MELPNYGVFDELRVFEVGPLPGPVGFRGLRLGLPICEDIWFEQVCECLLETGAEMLIVPNGSPYWQGKADVRQQVAIARVVETGLPMVYVNQCGGQDELVFDGGSFGLHGDRTLAFQLPQFAEAIETVTWQRDGDLGWRCADGRFATLPGLEEANWRACVLGLRDYVDKTGFPGVVLGLSGGINSAVCATMAVDALGAGSRPLRHAALPLHLQRKPHRCRRTRRELGRPLRHRADRRAGRRLRRGAEADVRRQRRPTPPRRTCSRAPAARS